MLQNAKIKGFIELGQFLEQFSKNEVSKNLMVHNNDSFFDDFNALIDLSQSHNGWFTKSNVIFAVQSWANALKEENLTRWLYNVNIA